tara:strand:+ start:827 stop:958 length:132 start_codon:yes stop_codon:yes gene_type:complete
MERKIGRRYRCKKRTKCSERRIKYRTKRINENRIGIGIGKGIG